MNYGKITNPDTAAGRLWGILRANPGRPFTAKSLRELSHPDPMKQIEAVSTRIQEVRQQLPDGFTLKTVRRGQLFFYVLELDK